MRLLDHELWGNALRVWLAAFTLLVFVLIAIALFRRISRPSDDPVTGQTRFGHLLQDLLQKTHLTLVLIISFFFVAKSLILPSLAWAVIRGGAIMAALVQFGVWISAGLDYWVRRYKRERIESDASAVTTITAVVFMGKLALWLILVLVALDNFGVEITPLVTGLGIGGVALALATQNILGDLFASLSIVVDKPFVIGDFIVVGDFVGNVERIGLKTTRVRSLGGEQIIMSNGDLLQSRIRNYKRMAERRIVYTFGVSYETPPEKLAQIPSIVREAIGELEHARFDRSHFKGFGDWACLFESVFWVTVPDYNVYMDVQQDLNLRLARAFSAERIRFAHPVRRVFVEPSTRSEPSIGTESSSGALSEERSGST